MNSEDLKKKLEAFRERRARSGARRRAARFLGVEPAGCGSYVLQRVLCGKPTCRCARVGGELHGPYWYHYWKMDRKTKSKYVGKNRPAEGA
jgi:hypothetical protein